MKDVMVLTGNISGKTSDMYYQCIFKLVFFSFSKGKITIYQEVMGER